jgi:anti-sigma-K factor RskA
MTHLRPEQLLDVAEQTRSADEFPHLRSCAVCARQVAELRGVIDAAASVRVPEPSPLFWDHLSARVRAAIADEPRAADRRTRWTANGWWRFAAAAAAIAAVILVVWPASRRASTPATSEAPALVAADLPQPDDVHAFDDDPALTLLADLSAGLDWEAASEAGLVPAQGAIDRVVLNLSPEERAELHRLLEEALAAAGA